MDEEQVVSTEVAEEPKETQAEPEATTETKTEEVAEVVEKPKKTAKERIDELTRKRRDAERDAEYWKNKALEKEPPKVDAPVSGRPRLDQFETTEAYEDALLDWKLGQIEAQKQKAKQAEEQEAATRTFQERAQKLRAEYDDFDEVIEQPVFSPAMRDALLVSENGPQVAYHLGSNPAEAERIMRLPVVHQLLELGKLETKILLAKATKKAPAAPPPINPVGMGGTQEKDPSKMSDDEWFAWNKEQQKKEIEARLKARGRI